MNSISREEIDARHDGRMDAIEKMGAEIHKKIDSLHKTIIITWIGVVIFSILGVSAVNSALFNNMLAAFTSGQDLATVQADVRRQLRETDALLKQIQADANKKSSHSFPPERD